jgi:hypothetical protein
MLLLFLVSGVGVRYSLRTRSPRAFARERLTRLLVPFVVGLTVLVPPMFYIGQLGKSGFHESYGRFWLSFLNLPAIAGGLVLRGSWTSGGLEFDPAHMWFLYVLLAFSIALLPLFMRLRSFEGARFIDRLAAFSDRHGVLVLGAAALPLVLVEAGAWGIIRWNAPIFGKYVALVLVSFAGTLALYEVLVRRFRFTRLLFGMKPASARSA